MNLIVLMGISGSGKSCKAETFVQQGYMRVCMDDLRKWYTGDICNQSQNHRVAEDAFVIVNYLLHKGKDVVWDATSTNSGTRNRLLKIAADTGASTQLIVLTDSENFALCQSRVRKDIENKVDRANTVFDDGSIMARQYSAYMTALKAIDREGWGNILKSGSR